MGCCGTNFITTVMDVFGRITPEVFSSLNTLSLQSNINYKKNMNCEYVIIMSNTSRQFIFLEKIENLYSFLQLGFHKNYLHIGYIKFVWQEKLKQHIKMDYGKYYKLSKKITWNVASTSELFTISTVFVPTAPRSICIKLTLFAPRCTLGPEKQRIMKWNSEFYIYVHWFSLLILQLLIYVTYLHLSRIRHIWWQLCWCYQWQQHWNSLWM